MLTKKQMDLLEFIHKRVQRDGVPPSFDEMKDALDLRSKSGIHRLITALEERGFIRRLADRPDRPANSIPLSNGATTLPLMGRIAAGVPIEAISEKSNDVSVPSTMLSSKGHHYALEVKGDSMIDAGINDGDVVVIREASTAENGEFVVALVEGHEATLKRFRRKGATIALEAANPAYETRLFQDDQVKVQGKLVGLIRTY